MAVCTFSCLISNQERLSDLRERLSEYWEPFLYLRNTIEDYMYLLKEDDKIHETRSEVDVDLDLLKEVVRKLELEYANAKAEFYELQLLSIYADRRRCMLLRELHNMLGKGLKLEDDFRNWIKWVLLDVEWDDILRLTNDREEALMNRAMVDQVSLKKQIINPEKLDNNPDAIRAQCKKCFEEFDAVIMKTEENLEAYNEIPQMCESLKELIDLLENRMADDGRKEVGGSQLVHN